MNAFPPPSAAQPTPDLSRDQLVASSAAWLAVSLNLGCQGVGYIYQRRWRAFWLGGLAAFSAALALGLGSASLVTQLPVASRPPGLEDNSELSVGALMLGAYAGLMAVGIGSAVEAGVAVNRARRRLGRP